MHMHLIFKDIITRINNNQYNINNLTFKIKKNKTIIRVIIPLIKENININYKTNIISILINIIIITLNITLTKEIK